MKMNKTGMFSTIVHSESTVETPATSTEWDFISVDDDAVQSNKELGSNTNKTNSGILVNLTSSVLPTTTKELPHEVVARTTTKIFHQQNLTASFNVTTFSQLSSETIGSDSALLVSSPMVPSAVIVDERPSRESNHITKLPLIEIPGMHIVFIFFSPSLPWPCTKS